MNKIKIKLVICILLQLATANVFAQHNPILENFTIIEDNGKVFLNWTIISGSTCNGIQIYRTSDGINFLEIGNIAGVCGSSSSAINYNFTDNDPEKNKINSYRLNLGGNGTSEILTIEIIDIANGGYQIRPNPVIDKAKIYFHNNTKHQHQLYIYNLIGIQVYYLKTNEDFFELNGTTFRPGVYLFTIVTEENLLKASGRIMMQ